jgi:N-methylhydantoinase A/oxoprolinase/acetone carboxylase beta subunit
VSGDQVDVGDIAATPLALGIDTGGTYTDAVLFDRGADRIVGTAKALTTHAELAGGIAAAIDAVCIAADRPPSDIGLVSLSTTLATNALVEGRGRPVGAVLIGFDTASHDVGLRRALDGGPLLSVAGGHDAHGDEAAALDADAAVEAVRQWVGAVDGLAVASQFSVRNPDHEERMAAALRTAFGKPVTLSHHLSARLNGPKRAVTAVLNAQLIPIIVEWADSVAQVLSARSIHATVMAVRGDGSLAGLDFVRSRPIETILSGPAASVVGAAYLGGGLASAIVSDIGGTTTDVAVLRDGLPSIADDGAVVGGHRTMVRAVDMHTAGLGGDSWVRPNGRTEGLELLIGPRRVMPISRLVAGLGDLVGAAVCGRMEQQLRDVSPSDLAGQFVGLGADTGGRETTNPDTERDLLERVQGGPQALADLATSSVRRRVIDQLIRSGRLVHAAFTPTDACLVADQREADEVAPSTVSLPSMAADLAAELVSRQRDRRGTAVAADAGEVAKKTVDDVVRRSAELLLGVLLDGDGFDAAEVRGPLLRRALDHRAKEVDSPLSLAAQPESSSSVRLSVASALPVVALGASAHRYYPDVAALLGTQAHVPEYADVANAVGAVVGVIRLRREVLVTSPAVDMFIVQSGQRQTVTAVDEARRLAEEAAVASVSDDMLAAGAGAFEISVEWRPTIVSLDGRDVLVEAAAVATAVGRPEFADG